MLEQTIRNNTAEFLIFQIEGKEDGVQIVYHNESVWCTQKAMAKLFDVGIPAISQHPNNIFEEEEFRLDSTISTMEIVESDTIIKQPRQSRLLANQESQTNYIRSEISRTC